MFASQQLGALSLEDLVNDLSEKHNISITKQAIQERFNEKAVDFMMSLLNEQLKHQLSELPESKKAEYSRFRSLKIKDSTRYTLPESYASKYKGHGGVSSPAQISIQYEYDLLSGKPLVLDLTSACRNDQQDSRETLQDIQKGDLLMRDLAYVSQAYLTYITEVEAYYLNRLNTKWVVLDAKDEPIDFRQISRKLQRYSLPAMEVEGFIRIGKKRLKTRLIASKVPEKVYQKRIENARKASKSKGYNVTEEYKLKASMNLFITNIPTEWLNTHQVRETYSLRWQIELIFKVWKSQAQIDKMKDMKLYRFECQLIARFLWLLLQAQVLARIKQWCHINGLQFKCSFWKFYKTAFRLSQLLRNVVFGNAKTSEWVEKILDRPHKKYATEAKINKKCSLNTIQNILA